MYDTDLQPPQRRWFFRAGNYCALPDFRGVDDSGTTIAPTMDPVSTGHLHRVEVGIHRVVLLRCVSVLRSFKSLVVRVPNGLGGLQSFEVRHRCPVWCMSFGRLVRLGEKTPGPGPGTDDRSIDQGLI